MIHKDDIIADLHTHTTGSLHAFSTAKENIDEARKNGLKYLAITDHFYGYPGHIPKLNEIGRFNLLEECLNVYADICIIGGVEMNFLHNNPAIRTIKENVRWRICGTHTWFFDGGNTSLDDLFKNIMELVNDNTITALCHIERDLLRFKNTNHGHTIKTFLSSIVDLCKAKDLPIELNEYSLQAGDALQNERIRFWLESARKNKNIIYLGSDAHYCCSVGKFDNCLKLLNEVSYPKELILNCNEGLLQNYLFSGSSGAFSTAG